MAYSCLLNGDITTLDHAGLPLTDLGVLRGYGYSEYIRTYKGIPFLLKEHLERLEASSHVVRLSLPYPITQIEKWVVALLQKNAFAESHIKIVVTGGPSDDGMAVSTPSFFILVTPLTPFKETFYTNGVRVMTYEHLREFPRAKGLNYMTTIALREEKKEKDIFELVYTYKGNVLEASTSNIFFVFGKTVVTPKDHVLSGVTRNIVIDVAQQKGKVEQRDISIAEAKKADEVFITGSYKEIMPVVKIDETFIREGKPGKFTQKLIQDYRIYIQQWLRNKSK